jgi:predicted HTH transcriptional regulator
MRVTFKAQSVQEADTDLGSQSTVEKSREKSMEKSREKVLSLVEENTNITTAEMATGLGLSQAGIEKIIRNLKSEGRLRHVGSDKGGSWEVIKQ